MWSEGRKEGRKRVGNIRESLGVCRVLHCGLIIRILMLRLPVCLFSAMSPLVIHNFHIIISPQTFPSNPHFYPHSLIPTTCSATDCLFNTLISYDFSMSFFILQLFHFIHICQTFSYIFSITWSAMPSPAPSLLNSCTRWESDETSLVNIQSSCHWFNSYHTRETLTVILKYYSFFT